MAAMDTGLRRYDMEIAEANKMTKRWILSCGLAAGMGLALAGCTNPYDPGQRALGGAAIGAGSGAALGGAVGGWNGAALGAAVGGAVGAITGVATTPPPPPPPPPPRYGYGPPPGY
jgi:hypothetical protein